MRRLFDVRRRRGTGFRLLFGLVTGAMLASVLALGAAPAGAQPAHCSVANADGGINVTWDGMVNADTYVYRLEVAGQNNRYKRVHDTSAFIELAEGAVGTVFVSAVLANGSYTASAACGSGQANTGSGQVDPQCSVADADGGIDASWSDISGAVEYVYRLEVAGQPNRYRRVSDTQAFIPLPVDVVGNVFVSGVRANGSYTPAIGCGSGQANEGTGTVAPTCSAESAAAGIAISWSAIDGADRYVYRLEVPGKNNRYGVAPAVAHPSTIVALEPGTEGTLFVSAALSDGSYTPAVACGSAVAGGGNSIAAPAACSTTSIPSGADASWSAVTNAVSYILYETQYRTDVLKETSVTGTSTTYDSLPLWRNPGLSVAAVDAAGNVSDRTSCGSLTAGTPNGPDCAAVINGPLVSVTWGSVPHPTQYARVIYSVNGVEQSSSAIGSGAYGFPLAAGDTLDSVEVVAQVLSGGPQPFGITTNPAVCTISGNSGVVFPAAPAPCTIAETSTDGIGEISVDWAAVTVPTLSPTQTAVYQLQVHIDNGGATFVEEIDIATTSFVSPDPQGSVALIETPWALYNGDNVSAKVKVLIRDSTSISDQEGDFADCGDVTIAGSGSAGGSAIAPASCTLNGADVTFTNPYNAVVRVRLQPFRAPHLFTFVGGGTTYQVQNQPSPAAGTGVWVSFIDDFGVPSAETACGQIEA